MQVEKGDGDVPPASHVVLVHGLLLFAGAMRWFAARLRDAGFSTETFGYHSIIGGSEAVQDALAERLVRGGPVHLVAHSLGGLLALETLARHGRLAVSRVVCLGTPLCGSGAAESLAQRPMLRWWLGQQFLADTVGVNIGRVDKIASGVAVDIEHFASSCISRLPLARSVRHGAETEWTDDKARSTESTKISE